MKLIGDSGGTLKITPTAPGSSTTGTKNSQKPMSLLAMPVSTWKLA
jgi:hypothetical protein